jgi:hypothetical protein
LDHNLIGSQVEVVGTGEKQRNRTCKLHKGVPCGSQLHVGMFVCFRKNWFAWRNEKDEDVLEVFVVKNGIQGCKVGYLPKHLAAWVDHYDGLCARIVEIYSSNCTTCDNVAKRQKYHHNIGCCLAVIIGDARDVCRVAI